MGQNIIVDDLAYTFVSLIQTPCDEGIKTRFVASHIEGFIEPLVLLDAIRKEMLRFTPNL
jgi:hypothetical protein